MSNVEMAPVIEAYFRDHGDNADQPSQHIDIDEDGLYHLSNVNGDLAVYRELESGEFVKEPAMSGQPTDEERENAIRLRNIAERITQAAETHIGNVVLDNDLDDADEGFVRREVALYFAGYLNEEMQDAVAALMAKQKDQ